jgi:hypothetical protein
VFGSAPQLTALITIRRPSALPVAVASIVPGHPVIRPDGRDLVKEALAVGNVPEGSARGGKVPFGVVLAKELLNRVGSPWEPGDMVVVDERRPGRIVRRVSHEQGRAVHRQAGAELFLENQAAGRMGPSPPIGGA